MKKRLWSLFGKAAGILGALCAIAGFLVAIPSICAVADLLGLFDFGLDNYGDLESNGGWVLLFLLAVLLVFGLLWAAFNRLERWADRKFSAIYERERQKAKQEAEERRRAQEAEYQARLAAMTPEERRRHDEELERDRKRRQEEEEREKMITLLAIQRVGEEKIRAAQARAAGLAGAAVSSDRSRMHDDLDAVARAMEITRKYGPDWKGYDAEAPGPDPESYGPDPETYPTDIW